MRFQSAAFVAAVLSGRAADARSCDDDLSVRISGGVVHGMVDNATPAVRQFLGIPYAQPPLNDLRFAPPKPALPFGELEATSMGPSCVQYLSELPNLYVDEVLEYNMGGLNNSVGPISEDCLTLSIWAPRSKDKTDLPVLLFFYGGAFNTGGTNMPYTLPQEWIQRTQSHIVIAFNHRDNIFGFPNAAGLPSDDQNVGLLDQRLVIEWVRDNIAAFGGDPTRIGIWGQSSGGCAIGYYSYAFKEDPIVNSIIMDSGNEFIDILTYDTAHNNFTFVASQLGCANLSPADELSCMRKVDAQAIEDFIHAYYDAGTTPILTFSPVVENRTIFANYTALGEAGEIAHLPALIGSNAQDGVAFVPYSPDGVDTALADETTMVWFFCPSYAAARNRIAIYTGPVYRYLYSGNFTNVSPKGWMGAYHGSEQPMLFGTHPLFRGNSTELEYLTSYAMQDAWVAFVATAGTKPSIEGWDAWDKVDGGQVVEFGNGVPARLIDTTALEASCGLQGVAL